MNVKGSRKRSRDGNDCTDCLPLSKRINSLTINNSNLALAPDGFFHVNVNVDPNICNLPDNVISNWSSPSIPHLPADELIPGFSLQYSQQQNPAWSQQPSSHNNLLNEQNCHTIFINNESTGSLSHIEESNQSQHMSWVNRLKYSHDNVESEYFVNNRLLFDLYVERISRTGQSPASPY